MIIYRDYNPGEILVFSITLFLIVAAAAPAGALGGAHGEPVPASVTAERAVPAVPATNEPAPTAVDPSNASTTTAAPVTITGCTSIEANGTYVLAGNVSVATTGDCLVVNATDVVIDGQGNALVGNGSGYGIAIESGVDSAGTGNLTVRNLAVEWWNRGLVLYGATNVTIEDVQVRRTVSVGVVVGDTRTLAIRNLTASDHAFFGVGTQNVADATVRDVRVTDTADLGSTPAGFEFDNTSVDARNLTVRDAPGGVRAIGGSDGLVRNLTVRGATTAVNVTTHAGLRFEAVDTGTATVSFEATNASVGPVRTVPTPRTPPGTRNATGHLRLTPLTSDASVAVDYGTTVAEVYEASLTSRRYDAGSWLQEGSFDRSNDTVTFEPRGSAGVYGAFYGPSTLTSCGVLDAPGVYEVGSFDGIVGPGDVCFEVAADDVTIVGATADATVAGDGNGSAVADTSGLTRRTNVTVAGLAIEGYDLAVDLNDVEGPTVQDVAVRNARGGVGVNRADDVRLAAIVVENATVGLAVEASDELVATNVSIRNTSRNGISLLSVANASVRGVDVTDASGIGVLATGTDGLELVDVRVRSVTPGRLNPFAGRLSPGTGLVVGGNADLGAANVTVRDADRGVWVLAPTSGTLRDLHTRGTPVAVNATAAAPNLTFAGVDTETTTPRAAFAVSNATVGPAGTAPSPATPGDVRNATGHLRLAPTGPNPVVAVDSGAAVAEVYEASLTAREYDDATNAWVNAGTVDRSTDTVTFVPPGSGGTYGVFYEPSVVDACGAIDAPGVYEVASFSGVVADGGVCLPIAASDVTVVGTTDGATLTGDGNGTAVDVFAGTDGTSRSNVTVRGLAVEGYATGVEFANGSGLVGRDLRAVDTGIGIILRSATDARVVDVAVENASQGGVVAADAAAVAVENVTVRNASGGGVVLVEVANGSVRNATVERSRPFGVVVDSSANASIADVRVRTVTPGEFFGGPFAFGAGVTLSQAPNTTVRNASVRDADRAVWVAFPTDGTVRNVTGTDVDEAVNVSTDATGLRIRDVAVENATVGLEDPTRVVVAPAAPPITPAPADRPTRAGVVDVTGLPDGVTPGATLAFGYDPSRANATNLSVYERTGRDWNRLGGAVDASTRTVRALVRPTVGSTTRYAAFTTPEFTCPTIDATRSGDPNGDRLCEDVDGSGSAGFLDVVTLLFVDPGSLTSAGKAAFDFDGDGRFGFLDVVDLLFRI